MELKGLLQIQGQTSLVGVLKKIGEGLRLPEKNFSKLTMEPSVDLVVYRIRKDEVLLCLKLSKVANLGDPIISVNLVIRLNPNRRNKRRVLGLIQRLSIFD